MEKQIGPPISISFLHCHKTRFRPFGAFLVSYLSVCRSVCPQILFTDKNMAIIYLFFHVSYVVFLGHKVINKKPLMSIFKGVKISYHKVVSHWVLIRIKFVI
uniref:Uncharacterized protein n=1 Tax=Cacopsylla melanoneura TaxID=428564 RepID=A0A8D8Z785_9HEMI